MFDRGVKLHKNTPYNVGYDTPVIQYTNIPNEHKNESNKTIKIRNGKLPPKKLKDGSVYDGTWKNNVFDYSMGRVGIGPQTRGV